MRQIFATLFLEQIYLQELVQTMISSGVRVERGWATAQDARGKGAPSLDGGWIPFIYEEEKGRRRRNLVQGPILLKPALTVVIQYVDQHS